MFQLHTTQKNLQYYSTTVIAEVHSFNQLCDKVSSLTSLW